MFNEWVQLHIFYEGLSYESKKAVDHSSGGSLNKKKTIEEAKDVIETIAENEYFYASERTQKKGMLELNSVDALLAQNKEIAVQLAALTNKMENNQVAVVQAQAPPQEENEPEVECEQANYVNNPSRPPYDPNSKTYNPGWKNHPNFGWGNQQNHNQEHNKPYQANQYQNHNSNH